MSACAGDGACSRPARWVRREWTAGSAAYGAGASTQPYAPRRNGAPSAIIRCSRRSAMPVSHGSTRNAAVSSAASTARNSASGIDFHRSAMTCSASCTSLNRSATHAAVRVAARRATS